MKALVRGVSVLLAVAALSAAPLASAQEQAPLGSEKAKVSYVIGADVGRSLAPVAQEMDMAAFERAVGHALGGGEPLLPKEEMMATGQALMQRAAVRMGKAPAGTQAPAVAKDKAGLLIGADIGRSLLPLKGEFELPVLMQGLRAHLAGAKPLVGDAEAQQLREALGKRVKARMESEMAAMSTRNAAQGAEFLAKNKAVKGVFTTPSGLQYMVLRQGAGPRPKPSETVRVNYHGTLLDGTVFDSSYERKQPAEFGLSQVIPGWTEGVSMMPVGAKYRFWIPSQLAYGQNGPPGIGPNATLVFDVELMAIVK